MREPPIPVRVVVPIKDELAHSQAFADCMRAQTIPAPVLWLDDGSGAETKSWLGSGAHSIETSGLTIYEAWNLGFREAKHLAGGGPFHVLVSNNDVLVPPYALEAMSQALVEDETRGAAYPDFAAPWSDGPWTVKGRTLNVQETQGVWGSGGMLGFCFMLAGHRIPWRPLIQDLAYEWWYGDNALAEALAFAGLKQVKVLGLPIKHAHEGTAHAYDLAREKERDARLWATRRQLAQVDRLNRGARPAGRRDWRQRPPARPRPGG